MDSKYYLTQADLGTGQGVIAGLWAQGLEGLVDEVARAKFSHYYLDNPAGSGTCLLLNDAAKREAIGVQGLIPRAFYVGQRQVSVATLADFVVAPGHRSIGPALKLMRSCIALSKERFAFVYGTPNDKSSAILKRAGLRALGNLTRYTKIIRSENFWRTRLPRWIVPPVAMGVDALIACADISRSWLYGRHIGWSEQTSFGTEFEIIWRARDAEVMIGERSSSVLQWRYSSSDPDTPWRLSVATDSSKTPMGYVIWRQLDGIVMISDFFCSNLGASTRAMLHSFASYVRQFPVHRISLEFFGPKSVATALAACGFELRDKNPVVIVEHTDEMQGRRIAPDSIFLTSFDRDNDA